MCCFSPLKFFQLDFSLIQTTKKIKEQTSSQTPLQKPKHKSFEEKKKLFVLKSRKHSDNPKFQNRY